jgi:hypothetical protein
MPFKFVQLLLVMSTLVQEHTATNFFEMKGIIYCILFVCNVLMMCIRDHVVFQILAIIEAALCAESCVRTKSKLPATRMPLIVSEKVFKGISCPIYEVNSYCALDVHGI